MERYRADSRDVQPRTARKRGCSEVLGRVAAHALWVTLTIEVPERALVKAAELGVPVETLVSQAMDGIGEEPIPPGFRLCGEDEPPTMRPEEATAGI